VDSNVYGIELLAKKYPDASDVSWELSDILDLKLDEKGFDFVYSVGLIEHFDKLGTSKSIHAHFDLCRPRGFVLVTFPTPTFLYKCIRRAAEVADRWEFPDERPLHFAEVEHAIADAGGEVVHKSINWLIGLTQGYILARKCAD
jgi:cyclopropane fatty-acyl-phospholipid synthase-like methyltransferase